jgi:hypothetical protein
MPGSGFPTRVIDALAWIDRWVSAAGSSCCVGRSQEAMRRTLGDSRTGSEPETAAPPETAAHRKTAAPPGTAAHRKTAAHPDTAAQSDTAADL